MLKIKLFFLLGFVCVLVSYAQEKTSWDVSNPTGDWEFDELNLDTDEGTWMNLDVSPDGKEIVVIQDNAKYHHAYAQSEHIKNLNVTPYFLPPYCPNLNLIERLWKFMKKEVMHNTYYETYSEFYDAVIEFCGNTEKYSDELSSLMSQKFEILKAA